MMTDQAVHRREYDLNAEANRWTQLRDTFTNAMRTEIADDVAKVVARELEAFDGPITQPKLSALIRQALTVEPWAQMVDVEQLQRGDQTCLGTIVTVGRPMVDWPFTGPATHWDVEYVEGPGDDEPVLRRTYVAGQQLAAVRRR